MNLIKNAELGFVCSVYSFRLSDDRYMETVDN